MKKNKKILGYEFTLSNIIISIIVISFIIWGVNSYLYRKKALENFGIVNGKVTYLTNGTGLKVSLYPVIYYQYIINGVIYDSSQSSEYGLSPKKYDCIQIIYSINDPNVCEINFKKGIVPCE